MNRYFLNIYEAVLSVATGMGITFKTILTAPMTVQYPEEDIHGPYRKYKGPYQAISDRYRGFLECDTEICNACGACAMACPINCIVIEDQKIEKIMIKTRAGKEVPKMKEPTRYDIDLAKCMFCGLCVEPCPTGAIHFTREFEGATREFATLTRKFVKKGAA